jgi:hypothetical protein
MPTEKQLEKMARQPPSPAPQDDGWWQSVLSDPALDRATWVPITQRRLSEIPRPVLRIECLRCFRIVEIQHADAVRLYGPHAIWKDVANRLLDDGCQHRTGSREDDGCWPDWSPDSAMQQRKR